jgi:hypothetical protein
MADLSVIAQLRSAQIKSLLPFTRDEDFVGRENIIITINQIFSKWKFLRRIILKKLNEIGYAFSI